MADTNRGPWIIAGAIVIAAVLVVGALLYMRQQDQKREEECRAWQAEVAELAGVTELGRGVVAGAAEDDRPEGCPIP